MNNNIIPACIVGAGLFTVALKPAPQPAPIPQAEPVSVTTASVTGTGEPVIVWYGTNNLGRGEDASSATAYSALFRAWSDGSVEMKILRHSGVSNGSSRCDFSDCDWQVISSPQMACRTDINGDGEIEFGDLLAVLNQ